MNALQEIKLSAIEAAPDNPRRQLGDLGELAASMKELGVLQPLVVTPRNGGFMVVCGHRRHAAAMKAKLSAVPAIVRDLDEAQRVKAMLIENCQREGLAAIEEARAYQTLVELGVSQRQIAADVGKAQSHVSKRLALLKLPEDVLTELDSGGITIGDAVTIAKLAGEPDRIARVLDRQSWQSVEDAVEVELVSRERDKKIAVLAAEAEAEGLKVVLFSGGGGYQAELPKGVFGIHRSPQYGKVLPLDPAKHADQPCHAVAIHPRTFDRVPVCTDRKNHPKAKTPDEKWREKRSSPEDKEAAARREEEREQLTQAEEARLQFATDLFSRKSAVPKAVMVDFILRAMVEICKNGDGYEYAHTVLGLENGRDAIEKYASKGDAELLHVAFALALGEVDAMACWDWQWNEGPEAEAYISLLERFGYDVAPIEAAKLGRKAKKAAA